MRTFVTDWRTDRQTEAILKDQTVGPKSYNKPPIKLVSDSSRADICDEEAVTSVYLFPLENCMLYIPYWRSTMDVVCVTCVTSSRKEQCWTTNKQQPRNSNQVSRWGCVPVQPVEGKMYRLDVEKKSLEKVEQQRSDSGVGRQPQRKDFVWRYMESIPANFQKPAQVNNPTNHTRVFQHTPPLKSFLLQKRPVICKAYRVNDDSTEIPS